MQRGATAIIFDITDHPEAATEVIDLIYWLMRKSLCYRLYRRARSLSSPIGHEYFFLYWLPRAVESWLFQSPREIKTGFQNSFKRNQGEKLWCLTAGRDMTSGSSYQEYKFSQIKSHWMLDISKRNYNSTLQIKETKCTTFLWDDLDQV